ncbi:MAG: hypothetical protein WDO73_17235 [Ignavibacteriota bacterium]
MSTQPFEPKATAPANLVQIGASVEDVIQQRLAEERARLEAEAGLQKRESHHFKKPVEKPFTRQQRGSTTLLFGGLTWKHEKLVHGALVGLGYRAEAVPTPNVKAFQAGKEYGNNGSATRLISRSETWCSICKAWKSRGSPSRKSSTATCSLRLAPAALAASGCMKPSIAWRCATPVSMDSACSCSSSPAVSTSRTPKRAWKMNLDFFLGILNALNCGDVMNEVAYALRPYEVNAGQTDEVLDAGMDYLHEVFRKKQPWKLEGVLSKYLGGFSDKAEYIGKFVKQLKGDDYVPALEHCRDMFNEIEVDRLRVKPIVKITGEFWAQTTEGDGNFNMFNFLQKEGAQVLVEPIGTWIMYMIHQVIQKYKDFKGLEEGAVLPPVWKVGQRTKIEINYRQKVAKLKLAEAIFKGEYHKIVDALGSIAIT